jgi:membrane peptidoglycan carboxypeptidase
VTGVWIGNPNLERYPTQAKSSDAAKIWQEYMKRIEY